MSNATGPVVVGVDGSPESGAALDAAIREASCRSTQLHVVHVVDITPAILHLAGGETISTRDIAAERHDHVWESIRGTLEGSGVEVVRVDREGHAGSTIAEHASDVDAQLIVVGSRGLGRVKTLVLGSTAHAAINLADRSVLVVKVP